MGAIILKAFGLLLVYGLRTADLGYSPTVSFYIDLYPKGEYWVQFPRSMESECIYDSIKDILTCMGDYSYPSVTRRWKASPEEVLYVKVNCRVQDYYFINRYVCFCTNANMSRNTDESSFRVCQLRELEKQIFENLRSVQVLDLSGNYISEVEGNALAGLKNLTYLSLSGNPFSKLPDGILCNLPHIRFVHLSSTGLTAMPKLFAECGTLMEHPLEYLFMSKGSLTVIPMGSLTNLSQLVWLDVSSNRIHEIADGGLEGGTSLKVLDLSDNPLKFPLPNLCLALPRLEVLRVRSCGFQAWDHNRFRTCLSLEDLDLSGNRIEEVEGDFSETSQLRTLNLSGNRLVKVDPGFTLGNLTKLTHLDLSQNTIQNIYNTFLEKSQKLLSLNLSGNALSETSVLLNVLLGNLEELKSLDLSQNNFSVLPSKLFPSLPSLNLLDISQNEIGEIHPESFALMKGPDRMTLTGNHLRTILNGTFSVMSQLKVLDLSRNEISDVDADALPTNLTELYFSNNNLYDVPTAFRVKNFTSLVRLFLDRNKLSTLDKKCFQNFNSLQVLDLCWNRISVIDSSAFEHLGQLQKLNLEGNQLVLQGPGQSHLFLGATNLRLLNLAFNRIVDFPAVFNGLKSHLLNLRVLNVTGNPLDEITQPQPYTLDMQLQTLILDHCNLSYIDAQAFYGLTNLNRVYLRHNMLKQFPPFYVNRSVEFDLSWNPIECSCDMKWLKDDFWLEYGIQIVVALYYVDNCYNYVEGRAMQVMYVEREDFLCRTKIACPEFCSCFGSFKGAEPDVVKCGGGLKAIPRLISDVLTRLYLSGNDYQNIGELTAIEPSDLYHVDVLYLNSSKVMGFRDGFFSNQPLLRVLHLEDNLISELSEDIFANLGLLEELYLRDNSLSVLYPNTFKKLVSLKILDLRGNRLHFVHSAVTHVWEMTIPVQEIRLSNNPWYCSCATVTFRNWIATNFQLVPDWRSVTCGGVSVMDHPPKAYDCKRVLPKIYIHNGSKGLIVGLLLLVLFLVVTTALIFRSRKTFIALIFVKFGFGFRRSEWQMEKQYDAYILYNIYNKEGEAESWVSQELVAKLEQRDKPYRIFVPDRDVVHGESIVDSSAANISESRRTIVVVSESFVSSQWCNRTFQIAYRHMLTNKKHKLIIILHGKVKIRELDPVIKVFIMMGDYLKPDSRYFWERLNFELPDPKASEEPVNENDAAIGDTDVILQNAVASDGFGYNNSSHV